MTKRRIEPLRGSMQGDGEARLLGAEEVDQLLAMQHDEEEGNDEDEDQS